MLRVRSSFHLVLAGVGAAVTCAQAARTLGKGSRRWEVRSAGTGSKGQRWYARACLATASPRHYLLIRRHLATVPETARLLGEATTVHRLPGHHEHGVHWRRRHQARAGWYHQRSRLARDATITLAR